MEQDPNRTGLDLHETESMQYKTQVREMYLWCAKRDPKWKIISSILEKTNEIQEPKRRTRESMHEECLSHVHDLLRTKLNSSFHMKMKN